MSSPTSVDISTNAKRCRQCGIAKPIREFELPRHRICIHCRTRGVISRAEQAEQDQQAAREYALMKAQERADAVARGESPWKPLGDLAPTTDWYRNRDYATMAARQRRTDPAKPVTYRTIKICVRCKAHKHVSHFGHPRDRICLKCFDPSNPSTTT